MTSIFSINELAVKGTRISHRNIVDKIKKNPLVVPKFIDILPKLIEHSRHHVECWGVVSGSVIML